MKDTIAIIGSGFVGSTTAYTLILKNIIANILLIDINEIHCRAQVLDLSDALAFTTSATTISMGTFQEARNARIIIISAGAHQKPGQTRIELLATNKQVIENIISNLQPLNPNAIILMVSNPLDALTYHALQLCRLPSSQLFGSGTFLDSRRLSNAIAQQINIAPESVQAYVLGEHGDSQFPAWSMTKINGLPLSHFSALTPTILDEIAQKSRDEAYEIIAGKQATYYGIGTGIAVICHAILNDQKIVLPLSCFNKEYDACLSIPVILGKHGIETILPLVLNEKEKEQLRHSVKEIKKHR